MNIRQRLVQLEKVEKESVVPVLRIILEKGNGLVKYEGETLPRTEFDQRYPVRDTDSLIVLSVNYDTKGRGPNNLKEYLVSSGTQQGAKGE